MSTAAQGSEIGEGEPDRASYGPRPENQQRTRAPARPRGSTVIAMAETSSRETPLRSNEGVSGSKEQYVAVAPPTKRHADKEFDGTQAKRRRPTKKTAPAAQKSLAKRRDSVVAKDDEKSGGHETRQGTHDDLANACHLDESTRPSSHCLAAEQNASLQLSQPAADVEKDRETQLGTNSIADCTVQGRRATPLHSNDERVDSKAQSAAVGSPECRDGIDGPQDKRKEQEKSAPAAQESLTEHRDSVVAKDDKKSGGHETRQRTHDDLASACNVDESTRPSSHCPAAEQNASLQLGQPAADVEEDSGTQLGTNSIADCTVQGRRATPLRSSDERPDSKAQSAAVGSPKCKDGIDGPRDKRKEQEKSAPAAQESFIEHHDSVVAKDDKKSGSYETRQSTYDDLARASHVDESTTPSSHCPAAEQNASLQLRHPAADVEKDRGTQLGTNNTADCTVQGRRATPLHSSDERSDSKAQSAAVGSPECRDGIDGPQDRRKEQEKSAPAAQESLPEHRDSVVAKDDKKSGSHETRQRTHDDLASACNVDESTRPSSLSPAGEQNASLQAGQPAADVKTDRGIQLRTNSIADCTVQGSRATPLHSSDKRPDFKAQSAAVGSPECRDGIDGPRDKLEEQEKNAPAAQENLTERRDSVVAKDDKKSGSHETRRSTLDELASACHVDESTTPSSHCPAAEQNGSLHLGQPPAADVEKDRGTQLGTNSIADCMVSDESVDSKARSAAVGSPGCRDGIDGPRDKRKEQEKSAPAAQESLTEHHDSVVAKDDKKSGSYETRQSTQDDLASASHVDESTTSSSHCPAAEQNASLQLGHPAADVEKDRGTQLGTNNTADCTVQGRRATPLHSSDERPDSKAQSAAVEAPTKWHAEKELGFPECRQGLDEPQDRRKGQEKSAPAAQQSLTEHCDSVVAKDDKKSGGHATRQSTQNEPASACRLCTTHSSHAPAKGQNASLQLGQPAADAEKDCGTQLRTHNIVDCKVQGSRATPLRSSEVCGSEEQSAAVAAPTKRHAETELDGPQAKWRRLVERSTPAAQESLTERRDSVVAKDDKKSGDHEATQSTQNKPASACRLDKCTAPSSHAPAAGQNASLQLVQPTADVEKDRGTKLRTNNIADCMVQGSHATPLRSSDELLDSKAQSAAVEAPTKRHVEKELGFPECRQGLDEPQDRRKGQEKSAPAAQQSLTEHCDSVVAKDDKKSGGHETRQSTKNPLPGSSMHPMERDERPARICVRPSCRKGFRGWDKFCSRDCAVLRRREVIESYDPQTEHWVKVVAFYYPGREEVWDTLCCSSFLGNFFETPLVLRVPCSPTPHIFRNAEAAFQATKFWHRAREFRNLTGGEAFAKKRALGAPDFTYGGFGSNWNAMKAVLAAKFQPGTEVAGKLLGTGDAFLLEHNARRGRDAIWSNNNDGEGSNWLGLQLMLQRDRLRQSKGLSVSWGTYIAQHVNLLTGEPRNGPRLQWQDCVRRATYSLLMAMGEELPPRAWY